MHIAIDFNVRIYLNGKPEPPNSELWVFIQRSHVDHTTAVVLLPLISDAPGIYEGSWSGPLLSTHMYGGVDVILSYFKFMSVPANTNLTVTMVFTITKIQLYENLCENNLVKSPEGSYLRLMVGHAHKMIIDDPYYYP